MHFIGALTQSLVRFYALEVFDLTVKNGVASQIRVGEFLILSARRGSSWGNICPKTVSCQFGLALLNCLASNFF